MPESSQKSYLREGHGPRAVDTSRGQDKGRSGTRRSRESDDRSQQRSKHNLSRRSTKLESHHRQKSGGPLLSNRLAEQPCYELAVIGQPARSIVFGTSVETSVLVSLKLPTPDMAGAYRDSDTSHLIAIVSLIAETRGGEATPLEHGSLTGQKMLDSVHPIPEHYAESLACANPCQVVLGYFSFPDLLIRQPGTYRIRTTLCSTGTSTSAGSSILAADSDAIRVERRSRHRREFP